MTDYEKLREAELHIIYLKDSLHAATTGNIYPHFDVLQQTYAIRYNYLKSCQDTLREQQNAD